MGTRRPFSRRQFLRLAGGATAAVGLGQSLPMPPYATAAPDAAPDLTILAYNENAFGMFPSALEAVTAAAASGNRYPKQKADALRDDLSRGLGVDPEMIMLGSGSIEPLKIATQVFGAPGRGPVVADPTFEAVVTYAGLEDVEPIRVPLTGDHQLDVDRMLAAARDGGLLYVCNPNNPTAAVVDKDAMRTLIDGAPAGVPVLVDEAYHEWVDDRRYESCIEYVKQGRNVIVLRTFSKVYGLAGLRVGYAVASKGAVERMAPHRLQNSLNTAGIAAARASLADPASTVKVRARNAAIRGAFLAWLEARGFKAIPSSTNFVMVDIGRPVSPVIEALRERGFVVGRLFPSMPTHLRISLGTEEQMARFQPTLGEVLSAGPGVRG